MEVQEGVTEQVGEQVKEPLVDTAPAKEVKKRATSKKKPIKGEVTPKEVSKEPVPQIKKVATKKPVVPQVDKVVKDKKVADKVMSITPKKEGEGAIAVKEVLFVVGSVVAAHCAKGEASNGQWTISMGQADGVIASRVFKLLSEGRSPDPRYANANLEIYLLGEVKKKLTGVSITEFQAFPMINGRFVVVKATGKYKGIDESHHCPYPLINTLTSQYSFSPTPAVISTGDPVSSQPVSESKVLFY